MTEELFYKYTNNQCSYEERNAVEEWLEKCTDSELVILLQPRWDVAYEKMPDMPGIVLWDLVYEKIKRDSSVRAGIHKNKYVNIRSVWMAAACIVFLLVAGYSVFLMNDKTDFHANRQTIIIQPADTVTWVTIDNNRKDKKNILLKDNSKVVLFPYSVLRYAIDYNHTDRSIYLSGKADFTVAKNKAKPFTVYSGEVATTAVGTRFQVTNDSGLGVVSVKLYEGIVKIQSTRRQSIQGWENGKLLYPGEEVRFENGKATAKLNKVSNDTRNTLETNTVNTAAVDEISFSNTPLSEVFEKMGKMFGITISYNKKDIAGMHLTSTISSKDQPAYILDAIVQMNALSYEKNESGYTITRITDVK